VTAGWDACQGSPRNEDKQEAGTRKLPDGSWIISNRKGEEVRILAQDVDKLITMLGGCATKVVTPPLCIHMENYPKWRIDK